MSPRFIAADIPPDEARRVAALRALEVLDTPEEAEFDALARAAALVCDVPITLISLVDIDRQWFKARVGLDASQTPREQAFCAHAILQEQIFEVPDTLQDDRFADNPLVTNAPDIRFYAGAPLKLSTGETVGTFCVIDRVPRLLDQKQRDILRNLSEVATALLERRVQAKQAAALQIQLQQEQAELVASEQRHLSILGALIAGVVLHGPDGAIISANPSAELLLGLSYEQMIGKKSIDPLWRCVREDLSPWPGDTHPAIVALQTGQEVRDAVMGVHKPDGQLRWIAINARPMFLTGAEKPYQVVASFADITNRKHAEDALREKERFFNTLTQSLPGMVGYWDAQGVCQFANSVYQQLFGKTAQEVRGRHLRELYGKKHYELNRPHFEGVLAGEVQRFERVVPHPDGTKSYGVVQFVPDFADGKVVGFVSTATDVTEIKTRQFEVEKLNDELQRSNTLVIEASKSKGQFLANMSHEIRTPMNAVLGMLKLLGNTGLNKRQEDYREKAELASVSLLGLINDILDYSKVEAGKLTLELQPMRIDKLMRGLAVILSTTLGKKNVDVLFDIAPDVPPMVQADALRLQQVLVNLASNAIKFTEQGHVLVSLRSAAAQPDRERLQFVIADSGIGIAPENHERIFAGFTQAEASTTRKFGGTGLGLAISKRLIEVMGGSLKMQSALGEGTTFSFEIDMATAEVAELVPEQTPVLSALQKRVLIVDDNAVARELLFRTIDAWGWHVEVAPSAASAMERIQQDMESGEASFDLFCVDWQMPHMDGWQCARAIRTAYTNNGWAQPRVLMLSANGREMLDFVSMDDQKLLDGFMPKPWTASTLLEGALDLENSSVGLRTAERESRHVFRLRDMRILVVEDNLINQQVAEELLAGEGANVVLASNGRLGVDAVEASRFKGQLFDCVLMDLQMPVMDGYEATHAIRNTLGLQNLPIIAMTANAMRSDREQCLAAGMNDHVGKPFDLNQLVHTLLQVTSYRVPETAAVDDVTMFAEEPDALPAVQSRVDVSAALKRMGGNSKLYWRAVRDFLQALSGVPDEIRALLASDLQRAAMFAHTLKGNASTLGTMQLAELSAELEKAVLKEGYTRQVQELLPRLDEEVRAVQAELQALSDAHTPGEPVGSAPLAAPPPQAAARGDVAHSSGLREALTNLEALLAADDLQALELFADARVHFNQLSPDKLNPLEESLQSLDLEAALVQVRGLQATK